MHFFVIKKILLSWMNPTLRFNEISMTNGFKVNDDDEDLNVSRGWSARKWKSKSKGFNKSRLKCFTCHKPITSRMIVLREGDNNDSNQIVFASDKDGVLLEKKYRCVLPL